MPTTMKTGKAGLELIKSFEGLRLEAYKCPAGVWTIGYGHAGVDVTSNRISEEDAGLLLRSDLERFERCVNRCITQPMNQNQFDAFVSLAFNIGCAAFDKSTAVRRFNKKYSPEMVADAIQWFQKAGGKVLPGLVRRRDAEVALFLKPPAALED